MSLYSLGGLSIQVSSEVHRNAREECVFFLHDDKANNCHRQLKNQYIQVNFKLNRDYSESLIKRKIYSYQESSLHVTADGRLELQHLNSDGMNAIWNLVIDFKFLNFEYFFLSQPVEGDNFNHLVFNRFLLQHTFINHHGLIIHAAGGSINGKGMVFPAISGTGKSTLSHLLLPHSENQLFSEERIIMRRLDDGWHLWGTPWKGSGVIARNESAPLSALVFLSQAPETKISKLSPAAALRRLLETVSIPWYSQEWTDKGLAVCESLLRAIPAYELAFRPDQTVVQAVAELAASLD